MVWFRGRKVSQDSLEKYFEDKADEARYEKLIEQMNAAARDVKIVEWQGMEGYREVKE
jgi:hypothetical protein